jgi:hypothetical protein
MFAAANPSFGGSEVRDQRSEIRDQRSEVRGQMSRLRPASDFAPLSVAG